MTSFLTGLFGGGDNLWLTVSIALALVLVLIVLAVWLLKLVFTATGNAARGRNRRLGLVDTLPLDQKRQLLLIRRDGVEHLILAGGTNDLLIETNIEPVDAQAERTPSAHRAARTDMAGPPRANGASAPAVDDRPQASPSSHDKAAPSTQTPLHSAAQPSTPTAQPMPAPTVSPDDRPIAANPAKRGASLRYTGLLRPVSRMEPAFIPTPSEKSAQDEADSDMNEKTAKDEASQHQAEEFADDGREREENARN